MKKNKNLISGLNVLLTRNMDAVKGYQEAALGSKNEAFKQWMLDYSKQRKKFCSDIRTELKAMGENPDASSSLIAGLHRIWIDFKTDWINNDIEAIVDEIEAGENKTLDDYALVLKQSPMSVSTRVVLTQHQRKIKNALKSLQSLRASLQEMV